MTHENINFNLEHQYQLYLQRVALDENKMHPEQKKQLRQTFFGCAGQMLVMLRDDLQALPEDEAIEVLKDMFNQVGDYFLTIKGENN
jgi:hypothetical protein